MPLQRRLNGCKKIDDDDEKIENNLRIIGICCYCTLFT